MPSNPSCVGHTWTSFPFEHYAYASRIDTSPIAFLAHACGMSNSSLEERFFDKGYCLVEPSVVRATFDSSLQFPLSLTLLLSGLL